MRYKSVFTVEFDANDDAQAEQIATEHHEQIRDELRIEGSDHPYAIILEQVLDVGAVPTRALLAERDTKPI